MNTEHRKMAMVVVHSLLVFIEQQQLIAVDSVSLTIFLSQVKPRKRTAFTETQQAQLEEAFQRKNYISTAERVKLSKDIGLSVHTVLLLSLIHI